MCLPNFIEFQQISEDNPIIGYRTWKFLIKSQSLILKSEYQDFEWSFQNNLVTELTESNSGFYSYYYNNYYNNYYNYNYNYNNNYNNDYKNNYNYNNYSYIQGIVHHFGKIAIHKHGYRSERVKIDTLFTIRESDAKGSKEFLDWIKQFNELINKIAQAYNCKTIHYQDWKESNETTSNRT